MHVYSGCSPKHKLTCKCSNYSFIFVYSPHLGYLFPPFLAKSLTCFSTGRLSTAACLPSPRSSWRYCWRGEWGEAMWYFTAPLPIHCANNTTSYTVYEKPRISQFSLIIRILCTLSALKYNYVLLFCAFFYLLRVFPPLMKLAEQHYLPLVICEVRSSSVNKHGRLCGRVQPPFLKKRLRRMSRWHCRNNCQKVVKMRRFYPVDTVEDH